MELVEREMHKATCSECGSECEVPFKPAEGKRVLCNSCFKNSRSVRKTFGNRRYRKMYKAICAVCGSECEVPFRPTEGREVLCINCFRQKKN